MLNCKSNATSTLHDMHNILHTPLLSYHIYILFLIEVVEVL